MQVFKTVKEVTAYVRLQKEQGRSIGFVPTMGYLHEGHLSLITRSVSENDVTGVSIFVNPTQFGVGEDFETYPRDLAHDCTVAEGAGADFIFAPEPDEMYPHGYKTYVEVMDITHKLCGKSRPIHFKGVTTVVMKLLHISMADRAYFGQKDAQQLFVIKQMVRDLNMPVTIVGCPIVREADNLAKSSRNIYLSPQERKAALCLSRALFAAQDAIAGGARDALALKAAIRKEIEAEPLSKIEYIEAVDTENLEDVATLSGEVLFAVAVRFGTTRLIDNIIVTGESK